MGDYETNPNQRIISIPKEGKALCDTSHVYMKAQKESMLRAMKDLTPTNFLVWLYLASQADNYTFGWSPAAISKETSLKQSALQEGIRTLIKQNYLIQRDDSNIYDFYEIPKTKEEIEEMKICTHTDNKQSDETSGFHF